MTSVVGTNAARGRIAPTLESLLPSWTRSLRADRKSTNTVSGYLDGVRCFTDFLHELGLSQVVALITREHIEMFLERQLAATLESLPLHDVHGLTSSVALTRMRTRTGRAAFGRTSS
jgi:hypothetical protein